MKELWKLFSCWRTIPFVLNVVSKLDEKTKIIFDKKIQFMKKRVSSFKHYKKQQKVQKIFGNKSNLS